MIAFFFFFPGPEYLLVLHAGGVGLLDYARIWFKLAVSSPWLGQMSGEFVAE